MPQSFALMFTLRGPQKSGDQQLGRSRGGWGSKIQAVCDGLGHPVKFILPAGQVNDITPAVPLQVLPEGKPIAELV